MTSVDRSDVRQALRDLDRHGRTHVTARDVAKVLGLGRGAHRSIGHRLRQLPDQGALDRWSPPNVSNGVTWELVDPDAGLEVATDGGVNNSGSESVDDNVIVWEFACTCGEELEVPATEIDFSPTSLVKPDCPDCGEMMRHVGPVLDVCDECGQELLYRGCSGLGYDTVCERCYERMSEAVSL